jgi:pimeloyl-ACP methyl ester carboxylesterase
MVVLEARASGRCQTRAFEIENATVMLGDEATFDHVAKSFENPDWQVEATRSLSLPAILIHGVQDGVTSLSMSDNVHEKFTGPFERILLQNVGHFPQREDPEAVARDLAIFLNL